MDFILQEENKIDIDVLILQEQLKKEKYLHNYCPMSLQTLKNTDNNQVMFDLLKSVPVGSLEFVGSFLKKHYNIDNMNAIEVPEVLRKEEFLLREYSIVKKENLPKSGFYFTKYVSELKYFTHLGLIETLQYEDNREEPFLKDGLYQISKPIKILSEFRCFVMRDNLIAVTYYDGACDVLPDINKIKKMISMYMLDDTRPGAYSMDVAVIEEGDTVLLEIHTFSSVGLYSYIFGSELPWCYRLGLDWYIKYNTELKEWNGG